MAAGLTGQEEAVLQLADSGLRGGLLLNAVRQLGLTDTTFSAMLNGLIDRQEAEAAYPVLVHRMRRLRARYAGRRRRWDDDREVPRW